MKFMRNMFTNEVHFTTTYNDNYSINDNYCCVRLILVNLWRMKIRLGYKKYILCQTIGVTRNMWGKEEQNPTGWGDANISFNWGY